MEFKWINESKVEKGEKEDAFSIFAPAKTDYFVNPIPKNGMLDAPVGNAPIYYTEIEGDFVFRVHVRPNFQEVFDAAAVMIIENEKLWAKAAFEKTDFGTNAIVGVVTNPVSDDTNGVNIQGDAIWIQVARVGNCFAIHYSLDGERFYMMRLFTLPVKKRVKIGVEAQCPSGSGGYRDFDSLLIEKKTLSDLRMEK